MNDRILINDFMEEYNKIDNDTSRAKKINSIIKRKYCPIVEKRVVLNMLLEKTSTKEGIKYIDMFDNRINLICCVVTMYTNLYPDKDEEGNLKLYELYDAVTESGIIDAIYTIIGEKEVEELKIVNKTLMDTWYEKNAGVKAFINDEIRQLGEMFGLIAGLGSDKLTDLLGDEDKLGKVIDFASKRFSKN